MKPEASRQQGTDRAPYESPAIVYEGQISTRAGSQDFRSDENLPGVDPADIFGKGSN